LTLPLDPDERYVLAYLRSDRAEGAWWGWLIVKLLFAALFIVGLGTENRGLVNISFILLLVLDLYFSAKQPRFTRSISSAVEKLENRIQQLETVAKPVSEA
jgi:hypothetical protein